MVILRPNNKNSGDRLISLVIVYLVSSGANIRATFTASVGNIGKNKTNKVLVVVVMMIICANYNIHNEQP